MKVHKLTRNQIITTSLVFLAILSFIFILIQIRSFTNVRQASTSSQVRLELPPTLTVLPSTTFSLPVTLSTSSQPVSAIDIVLKFDPSFVNLQAIDLSSLISTNFKTIAPVDTQGNFTTSQVISQANSTGKLEFGLVTYDWVNQKSVSPVNATSLSLVNLSFNSLKAGSTQISFDVQDPVSTTDTNIVSSGSVPQELLQSVDQTTSTTLTIANPTST